jgi:hypothetical protein
MEYAISPNYKNTDFPSDMSLDQKIEVFADRVNGWQLNIAQRCADNIPHSGFAVLHIVCSYFEMIAKYKDGFTKDSQRGISGKYFRKGFDDVFPNLTEESSGNKERSLKKLYNDVRCGLYHSGITGPNIALSNFDDPIHFVASSDPSTDWVQINPQRLVFTLKAHFQLYIRELGDHQNSTLRDNFEVRFNYSHRR